MSATEFVTAVMNGLADDVPEIGYGMTDGFFRASRADLDRSFEQINSRR